MYALQYLVKLFFTLKTATEDSKFLFHFKIIPMRNLNVLFFLMISLFFTACGGDAAKVDAEKAKKEREAKANQVCIYSYDAAADNTVQWTAFKTMAKVGVSGKFPEITITGANPSEDIATMLNGVSIEIPVAGTITGDPARDKKIVEFFFAEMADTENITGVITSTEGDNTRGHGMLNLKINGVESEVKMRYNVTGNFFKMEGILNLDDFNAQAAVTNLNKNCDEKHTGDDGVSKLWPEVELRFVTQLKKACK